MPTCPSQPLGRIDAAVLVTASRDPKKSKKTYRISKIPSLSSPSKNQSNVSSSKIVKNRQKSSKIVGVIVIVVVGVIVVVVADKAEVDDQGAAGDLVRTAALDKIDVGGVGRVLARLPQHTVAEQLHQRVLAIGLAEGLRDLSWLCGARVVAVGGGGGRRAPR